MFGSMSVIQLNYILGFYLKNNTNDTVIIVGTHYSWNVPYLRVQLLIDFILFLHNFEIKL